MSDPIDYRAEAEDQERLRAYQEDRREMSRINMANIDAEATILGAMMLDNDLIDRYQDVLTAEHFFLKPHQRTYKLLIHLRGNDTIANPVTMVPYFQGDTDFGGVGGAGYLVELTGSGVSLLGVRSCVQQVIHLAQMRAVRDSAVSAANRLTTTLDPDLDAASLADEISAEMQRATEMGRPTKIRSIGDSIRRVRERHARAAAGESIGARCGTISDLNVLLGAAAPETLTVIGGRPGMGKTVLAMSAAWGYALLGHPTMIVSLEMSEDALAMRSSADLTFAMNEPVPYRDLTRNELTESQLKTIDEAACRADALPLRTVSPGRVTIEQIEALVGRYVSELARQGKKLETLWIDYAQIIAATGKLEGVAKINHITDRCLAMAKRFQCAVFLLSQVSRDVDKRPDKRPMAADLKESGKLEEDADAVLLVYRPEYYLRKEEPDKAKVKEWQEWDEELNIAKGRVDLMAVKVRVNEPATRRARFFGEHQAIRGSDFVLPMFDEVAPLLPPMPIASVSMPVA